MEHRWLINEKMKRCEDAVSNAIFKLDCESCERTERGLRNIILFISLKMKIYLFDIYPFQSSKQGLKFTVWYMEASCRQNVTIYCSLLSIGNNRKTNIDDNKIFSFSFKIIPATLSCLSCEVLIILPGQKVNHEVANNEIEMQLLL